MNKSEAEIVKWKKTFYDQIMLKFKGKKSKFEWVSLFHFSSQGQEFCIFLLFFLPYQGYIMQVELTLL